MSFTRCWGEYKADYCKCCEIVTSVICERTLDIKRCNTINNHHVFYNALKHLIINTQTREGKKNSQIKSKNNSCPMEKNF